MAAGALTALGGGTPSQITHAAAMALKNLLGLVCDPVGGLVEVPCVKRNVIGSVNALSAADMALAGIISRIPPDQVIDAMREVGDQMLPHVENREEMSEYADLIETNTDLLLQFRKISTAGLGLCL